VLGINFEPPELMAPQCDPVAPQTLRVFGSPVKMTWLILDPGATTLLPPGWSGAHDTLGHFHMERVSGGRA
jgi:hypothetical protein